MSCTRVSRRLFPLLLPVLGSMAVVGALHGQNGRSAAKPSVAAKLAELPLSFEPNAGQADTGIRYLAHGPGYALALRPTGASLRLQRSGQEAAAKAGASLGMRLLGANPRAAMSASQSLPGRVNYLIGNDPARWHTQLPTFARVTAREVYPAVDLVYYGAGRRLEYDFRVRAGGDPTQIRLSYTGASGLTLDAGGNLVLKTDGGSVVQHRPHVYQERDGARTEVSAAYVVSADRTVGFRLGAYDAGRELVIDPVLSYSGYLGGSGADAGAAIATDGTGATYVAGFTQSSNFPVRSVGFPSRLPAADAFVTKVSPSGSALVYSTYFGGSGIDRANGIAVDSAGSVTVVGETHSADLPTAQPFQSYHHDVQDAFITRLSPDGGHLVYSSFLGGTGLDNAYAVALDPTGDAYVAGYTAAADFPVLNGAQTNLAGAFDAFLTRVHLQDGGPSISYSTYLGGAAADGANGVAVDPYGVAYVGGQTASVDFPMVGSQQRDYAGGSSDGFLAVVATETPGPASLQGSTFLGGSGTDSVTGVALTLNGLYAAGVTSSRDLPLQNPLQGAVAALGGSDAFVSEVTVDCSILLFSSYLGGSGNDAATGIAADEEGNTYVVGYTTSRNLPVTSGAPKPTYSAGWDGFALKIKADHSAFGFVTYLGGSRNDQATAVAVDGVDSAYVTGYTYSSNFPVTVGVFPTGSITTGTYSDAFVLKLGTNRPPVARNDQYDVVVDTPQYVPAPGVLLNDVDGDRDRLTVTLATGPSHGIVTLNPDGGFTYLPDDLYTGTDSFTYTASDGKITSDPATVTLTIARANHAPVARDDTYYTGPDGAVRVGIPGPMLNDSDADGDPLKFQLVTGPAYGTLTQNGGGSFTYLLRGTYRGTDHFTYRVSDGKLSSNLATVNIVIVRANHAPVASNQAVTVRTGASASIHLRATDIDADGLLYRVITRPVHGTLVGTAPNLTYIPDAQFTGTDSLTFVANDRTADSNVGTVTITVVRGR